MALDLQLRAAFTQSGRNVDAAGEPGGDPSHKLFLAQKGKTGLKVALRLLREARAQSNVPWEGYHLRSPELLVLAAETAVKNGEFDSAKLACHEFFLDGGGARDQFYCRALFVKALVVSNSIERDRLVGAEATQRRSRAVDYLVQALDIAAEGGARYAFLAYNASVHAWNVLRTALRPRRAGDHATELLRFSDALEASNDSDLRWRCNLLMAVSLALGDKGDASAAAAKAALSVQHAEDLARGEREAADIARGRLNEAKDRVAVAQAQIRKMEEAGTCSADATILEDGGSEAGGASEGSILSASASGSGKSWLGTGEKLAAAVTSRASAEKDAVEAGRKLTPLAKTAAEAAALAERAWMFQAYSAAQGAAAGGSDATKVLEMLRSQASGDARREALLLQQEVAAGALTGDAVLQALNPVAEALDPGGVTLLAKAFARESAGQGGEVETTNGKDTTAIGGGDVGGSGGGGGGGVKKGGAEPLLPSLPTPSPEAQSVFVDLGRTALKAIKSASPDDLASSSPHELQHSLLLLNFARACHLRASSSAGKGKPTTGGSGTIPSPGASKDETAVVSPAAFRARLELLAAELAAHGMLSGHTSDGDGNNDLKLDARRTDAAKLADRVEALKRVERLLLNCKRLGDPELLQEGCCLAFSIGIPLLGKRHRKHVHRCFSLAAQILQDVESPLARLRAQLHLEVAKCEVDSDFLAKAASQVEKASGQDYGVSDAATLPPEAPLDGEWDDEPGKPFSEGNNDRPRGGIADSRGDGGGGAPTDDTPRAIAADSARLEAINDTLRPLDRFMMPLASFLRLKTSVDVEPTTAEDKALLLIDQGKHAADPLLRRTLMARAAEQLYIATSDQEALDGDDLRKAAPSSDPSKPTTTANTTGVASSAARGPQQQQLLLSESPVRAKEAAGLNRKDDDDEIFAARFAAQDADGSGEEEQAESIPQPSSKRLARLWFSLLELAWDKREGGGGGSGDGRTRSKGSVVDGRGGEGGGGRDAGLARKAAVAVLRSGPWSPERNRELVVLQARAQYMLGETYVEELRLADTDFLGSAGSDSQKPLGQVTDSNTGGDGPGPNSTKAAADPKDVTNKEESRGRHATKESQDGVGLDPRTMGIPTAACTAEVSSGVADMLDGLKKKACGCFVGGMRRAARAKEPALIENGAVFVYNFHMPVWKRRLHHLVMPDLQGALEACVAALEAMERPDTALLCSTYEALARTMSSSPSPSATSSTSAAQAEEVCLRAILALDRPDVNASGGTPAASTAGAAAGGKGAGGVKGKSGNTKKGDAVGTKDAESCGGATSARRATISELKGVVEVRAACQAARAGVAAVTGEGRPLFHALALLTAASVLSAGDGSDGATAATGDLVERCVAVMREYRGAIRSSTAARQARKKTRDGGSAEQGKSGVGAEATGASPAPAHEGGCSGGGGDGGGEGEEPEENKKIDLFAALSGRAGTSLEEDRAELELVGEIWCRLGKERLARGNKREAEECCGYVIELLPQIPADRRKVHPRLWRWLAVGEGLWGQAIASMVSPESQEKPLQDELRRVSMRHLALSAKFGTLASSSVVTLDIAKRLWNVALPLADTAAGRAIARSPVRAVLREMAKGGILEGGAVRAQLYVLLFECYSDRSEWKQGLAAVTDSLRFIPPEFQRPLWRWRVVFLSRLGITALDGVAKTKESDKVLQGKSWCTLARSAREPKQQLSAYLKALECLGDRFERLDCLVEMGEWATGRGLASAGADYLRAALDLLYDVEESAMQATEEEQEGGRSSGQDHGHDGDDRDNGKAADEEGTRCRGEASSRASSRSHQSGLKRSASKASSAHGTSHGGSRGSSRGAHGSQGGASSSAEPDQNGYPETLTMGHLETAVRVLTMLARGAGGGSGSGGGFSCSMFDERLDLLLQAHYFVGRMAAMVAETVECGRRWRLYEENVPEGTERAETPFQEWWDAHGEAAEATVLSPPAPGEEAEGKPSTGRPPPIASQPPVHLRDWASWRPESDPDLYRHMAVPPPGRAPYVLSTATIEKPPLLFHHLLDLAEGMEDHGLAAHAAAPLAMSELVARLCLGAPLSVPRRSADGDGAKPEEMKSGLSKVNSAAGGGKGASAVAGSKAGTGVGDGGDGENAEELVAAAESFPALALACLRRSRLLLKLGPTCQRAALQAAAAAGPLGVSAEEAARRGAEVDRILRQREEEDSGVALRRSSASHEGQQQQQQQQQRDQEQQVGLGGRVVVAPPSPDQAKATSSGGSKTVPTGSGSVEEAGGGLQNGANAGVTQPLPPTLGKLEDRKLWALLAKEAVLLGECQVAAEYLTAAQRHNDAFHDRENIVSCLEAQAALCDAQGHPEQGLPCLLRASALLRAPGVSGSTAGRWGKMAISIGGMMRKANMGDAKIRQALQTGCDALERSIFRNLDKLETGEEVGMTGEMGRLGASRSSMDTTNGVTRPSVVDLDAAIAFSGCISLLAEASGTLDDSNALAPPVLGVSTAARGTVVGQERPGRKMRNMCTASNATATRSVALLQDGASNEDGEQHRHQEHGVLPAAVRLLSDAADKLRPLGKHPALPAILRRMAQEWVRRWAKAPAATDTAARSVETPAAAARGAARGTTPSPAAGWSGLQPTDGHHTRTETLETNPDANKQHVGITRVSRAKCLENAAACLAEARAALSALAAAAEPTGDMLSSAPPAARERAPAKNESDDDDAEAPAAKAKGKNGKGGAGSQKGGNSKAAAAGDGKKNGGGGGAASSTSGGTPGAAGAGDFAQGSSDAAVLSTPVGRSLVMVQLEEACVRAMLGRIRGEARSSKKAEEAAANDEGTNPVQRYLEASRPLGHPTPEEMGVPQLEQALALAQMARERCSLSSFLAATSSSTCSSTTPSATETGEGGDGKSIPTGETNAPPTGLLPLALAWEGSTLALLAARAGLCDEAWSPRPPPPRPATPPQATTPDPATATKGGKGAASKGGKAAAEKGGKGGKGGAAAAAVVSGDDDEKTHVDVPPIQEGFNLREQARWKLARAMETAVAGKRWDAAGAAAFALAEMLGGNDAPSAAAALMLHQSCRARERMLRLLHTALPKSSRYRLCMDRVNTAQGSLRGMHNLDACDSFAVPRPVEAEASAVGAAGEGAVSSITEFPSSEASEKFLSANLAGWRRLDCATGSNNVGESSLRVLPQGLGVLSLQFSPDGTTLYAAGYAPPSPSAVETPSGGTDNAHDTRIVPAANAAFVWRHEMKAREVCALSDLGSRMKAFQGSVKRHCLEKCDEEGKRGDYNVVESASISDGTAITPQQHSATPLPSQSSRKAGSEHSDGNSQGGLKTASSTATVPVTSSAGTLATVATAECEVELDAIIAATESLLLPVFGEGIDGSLAPFLARCREEELSLILLLDESLENLPLEACAALGGIRSVSRDLSLSLLHHRLRSVPDASRDDGVVSNARMRYVADPLSQDPGVLPSPAPRLDAGGAVAAAGTSPKGKERGDGGKKKTAVAAESRDDQEEWSGRPSILKVLRERVGQDQSKAGGGGGKGATGSVKVAAWKGVAGDDHVPGVPEWQALVSGSASTAAPAGGPDRSEGGFVFYGLGRCLSKLSPESIAGLSVNCKAAILIDRADNSASRRLESKQETLKSPEEMDAEEPSQTAALFSLVGCQSVVLNMWSVTLHSNQRIICSLFRRWGEEGLTLGAALSAVRSETAVKPRARFGTVLYGLPTLKYGP